MNDGKSWGPRAGFRIFLDPEETSRGLYHHSGKKEDLHFNIGGGREKQSLPLEGRRALHADDIHQGPGPRLPLAFSF